MYEKSIEEPVGEVLSKEEPNIKLLWGDTETEEVIRKKKKLYLELINNYDDYYAFMKQFPHNKNTSSSDKGNMKLS